MAYEQRQLLFNYSKALAANCTALDTSLTLTTANDLPTVSGGSQYVPLVLANDAQGKEEVVWVTSHTSGSANITVVRGREGTSAQAFSAGDVVRCGPLPWDNVSFGTSSAMPANPFYGMRVLQTDTNEVVEYARSGKWQLSAPNQDVAGRKHRWYQGSADIATASSMIKVVGLSSTQNGTSGTIASQSGGNLTLNKAGLWTIGAQMYETSGANRNQGVQFVWTDGAFPGLSTLFQVVGVIGGGGAAGNGLVNMSWTGYVPAAAALNPITFWVWSSVTTSGGACNYTLFAEYLGG